MMCGADSMYGTWEDIYYMHAGLVVEKKGNLQPRYKISPTEDRYFVRHHEGQPSLDQGRWWLVPPWVKDLKDTNKFPTFNARSETVHEKASFKNSFKSKRCLILSNGYYEWTKNEDDDGKDPHYIHLPERRLYCFAGLWAYNKQLDVTSCTIITAPANDNIKHIHHRMPVILKPGVYDGWLDPETGVEDAKELLAEERSGELESYRVGREVNYRGAKGATLIEEV